MPAYRYRCSLVRVIDGDTVVLAIDVGFRFTATMPVRLYGINAPELNTAAGKSARTFTATWLAGASALEVATEKDPEKYGRWLGTIYRAGDLASLNDTLVAASMAQPYRP